MDKKITTRIVLLLIINIFAANYLYSFGQQKNQSTSQKALHWEILDDSSIQCTLCPRRCIMNKGQKGFCRARKNADGTLVLLTYAKPVATHIDPIEKKPLFHVLPGTKSFSIATAGCNLRCKFCQNWEISQLDPEKVNIASVSPQEIVDRAKKSNTKTIAFTYTEPTIFYEYMLDIAKLATTQKIKCVMHSAGYINPEPLRQIAKYLTACNIDLKGFSEEYYARYCQGSLAPVLNTLKILKEENVWIEITNLIVPGGNDSDKNITELCEWIKQNLGVDTPIHFSRFFPMYRLTNLSPTPLTSLTRARDIAQKVGLNFVYIGNTPMHIGENTSCPQCNKLLIKRLGYTVLENNIKEGRCPYCNYKIAGIWE